VRESFYVPVDSKGIEHSAVSGKTAWRLPADGAAHLTESDHLLVLRQPQALLDVLDEQIYRAEPSSETEPGPDGTVAVSSARLVAKTHWGTEAATRFALDCATHILRDAGDVALPDGTPLAKVIDDARQVLDGIASESKDHLGYLARIRALRRLRRDRSEVAEVSFGLLIDDEARDIDALDDAAYASVIPVTDSVLAAIEALRHHVLPEFYIDIEDTREEHEEHQNTDRLRAISNPTVVVTPFGPIEFGGPHVLSYEPAWAGAREAARHARLAAKDRHGGQGEADERSWQATMLASILE
jgi:hypothetical protein